MTNQREIKFRAWDLTKKRWDNIHTDYSKSKGAERYFEIDKEFIRFNRGDIILQQFTGLKDKNGKEIYEGDILTGNRRVYFEDGSFRSNDGQIDDDLYAIGVQYFKVIGNIYENPELLK